MYYALISNTAAPDLDESHTIRVTRNTESLNITCSVLTYVELVLRDAPVSEEDIKLTDLVKALYLYNQNANAVFGG